MRYLPIPSVCESSDLPRLPFRATLKLDENCLFADFPQQCGFPLKEDLSLLAGRPENELEDFIQSWLYFGFLAEWCGKELDLSSFKLVEDNGDAVIDTDRVQRLLKGMTWVELRI